MDQAIRIKWCGEQCILIHRDIKYPAKIAGRLSQSLVVAMTVTPWWSFEVSDQAVNRIMSTTQTFTV